MNTTEGKKKDLPKKKKVFSKKRGHEKMDFPPRAIVEKLKAKYRKGMRVELISMDDPYAPPKGTLGTVKGVDDIGSIMVKWDNGSGLSVAFGADRCKIVG